jgi:hypothetical protein
VRKAVPSSISSQPHIGNDGHLAPMLSPRRTFCVPMAHASNAKLKRMKTRPSCNDIELVLRTCKLASRFAINGIVLMVRGVEEK